MMDLYDGLLEELECKICMTYMGPPIRQCETGHSVCDPCRKKLKHCALCQGKFTDARNISLETLARKMHYPCSNVNMGCNVRSTFETREIHERACSFKPHKCCFPRCAWAGKYEDVMKHWREKKTAGRPYRDTNVCHTKVNRSENFYVNLLDAYNHLFWFKFKNSGGILYWSVQLIGYSELAPKYSFEVEIFKPGDSVKKYIMSDYCQPEGSDETETCVMTSMAAINSYFDDDNVLIYFLRVKSVADDVTSVQSVQNAYETNSNDNKIHKKPFNKPPFNRNRAHSQTRNKYHN